MAKSVVIVGGGIIGTACAYYLARRGHAVTILEQAQLGKACSHGNCGLISPSHVLPLAEPGVVRKTLPSMLRGDSPLHVKLRWDPALWSWLLKFSGRCNERDLHESAVSLQALLNSSTALYRCLLTDEGFAPEWQDRGCYYVYRLVKGFEGFRHEADLLRSYGVTVDEIPREDLLAREPALLPEVAGAWYFPADAHLRPDKLIQQWRSALERLGVKIVENCRVLRLSPDAGEIRQAETTVGTFPADQFVVAAGATTPEWQSRLKTRLPIQPGKGYSLTMPRPRHCPTASMIFQECKVAVTPMDSAYRLGSTMEFSGYDASLNARRIQAIRAGARQFLKEPECEPIQEQWYGWRPMTYDSKPIIDMAPGAPNTLIAAGHSMLGLTLAPVTGRLAAELLDGEEPHLDVRPLRASRF